MFRVWFGTTIKMKSYDIYFKNITFKDFTIEKWANNSNFWPYFWVIGSVYDEIWKNTRIQTRGSYIKNTGL